MLATAIKTQSIIFEPSSEWSLIGDCTLRGGAVAAWLTSHAEDPLWDAFLQGLPHGQFQQSGMWAQAKLAEGWKPIRVVITLDGNLVGGFQLLWQSRWLGRIGYVSKGPVVLEGHQGLEEYAVHLLREVARREGLLALVVQPPDFSPEISAIAASSGFLPNLLVEVNAGTWIVDLKDGFVTTERRMNRTTRNRVRRAVKMGLTIREGGRQDLATFFDLMLVSCRHQGTKPNPPELKDLVALWDALSTSGCVRLYFAEYEGEPLSGHLDILFGKTATMWKMGGGPGDKALAPNDFIFHQGIQWACQNGYDCCDFAAFDRQMAVSILKGDSFTEEQLRSRYLFLTRFSGRPCLLPIALAYIPNRLLRSAYRLCFYKQLRNLETEARATQELAPYGTS
jgi:peptidoglycan pentaglycine glycine transferase (the first glycine)